MIFRREIWKNIGNNKQAKPQEFYYYLRGNVNFVGVNKIQNNSAPINFKERKKLMSRKIRISLKTYKSRNFPTFWPLLCKKNLNVRDEVSFSMLTKWQPPLLPKFAT